MSEKKMVAVSGSGRVRGRDVEVGDEFTRWIGKLVDDALATGVDEQGVRHETRILVGEYAELPASRKLLVRRHLDSRVEDAVEVGDFGTCRELMAARRTLVALGSKKKSGPRAMRIAREKLDYLISVQIAYAMLRDDIIAAVDSGAVPYDWEDEVARRATTEAKERASGYRKFIQDKYKGVEPRTADQVEVVAGRIAAGRAPAGQGRKPRGATVTGSTGSSSVVPHTDKSAGPGNATRLLAAAGRTVGAPNAPEHAEPEGGERSRETPERHDASRATVDAAADDGGASVPDAAAVAEATKVAAEPGSAFAPDTAAVASGRSGSPVASPQPAARADAHDAGGVVSECAATAIPDPEVELGYTGDPLPAVTDADVKRFMSEMGR